MYCDMMHTHIPSYDMMKDDEGGVTAAFMHTYAHECTHKYVRICIDTYIYCWVIQDEEDVVPASFTARVLVCLQTVLTSLSLPHTLHLLAAREFRYYHGYYAHACSQGIDILTLYAHRYEHACMYMHMLSARDSTHSEHSHADMHTFYTEAHAAYSDSRFHVRALMACTYAGAFTKPRPQNWAAVSITRVTWSCLHDFYMICPKMGSRRASGIFI